MHATVNTDIKTRVHFFFISNPPLKKLLFQLLIKTLSKRSFASVILLFAIIKKTKLIIKKKKRAKSKKNHKKTTISNKKITLRAV